MQAITVEIENVLSILRCVCPLFSELSIPSLTQAPKRRRIGPTKRDDCQCEHYIIITCITYACMWGSLRPIIITHTHTLHTYTCESFSFVRFVILLYKYTFAPSSTLFAISETISTDVLTREFMPLSEICRRGRNGVARTTMPFVSLPHQEQ